MALMWIPRGGAIAKPQLPHQRTSTARASPGGGEFPDPGSVGSQYSRQRVAESESVGLMSSESKSCTSVAVVCFSPSMLYEYSLAAVITLNVSVWMLMQARCRPIVLLRLPIQKPSAALAAAEPTSSQKMAH